MAVDAITGRVFWKYVHTNSVKAQVCCGANNRGVAVLGDKVFMGTLDARLVAIDRITGKAADFNQDNHVFMARRRHVDALQRALHCLHQAVSSFAASRSGELVAEDLRAAQQNLNEITGEFTSEDLLGKIFSSFCIGK
jgi:tRNA U34 5-carboxymethylaminomethyl modifying GTPase MnmE/TrmE